MDGQDLKVLEIDDMLHSITVSALAAEKLAVQVTAKLHCAPSNFLLPTRFGGRVYDPHYQDRRRRKPRGQRQSVRERGYVAHVYNREGDEGLAAVFITDEEYPARAAFSVLTKLLDEFSTKVPHGVNTPSSWKIRT
ncbi:hypothetical protein B0H34DRAFT_831741 [Crassisporium funariophilum]|nr:hypothetical protein B0H34DRAFT_831741 [Crassisporium funariophilum]